MGRFIVLALYLSLSLSLSLSVSVVLCRSLSLSLLSLSPALHMFLYLSLCIFLNNGPEPGLFLFILVLFTRQILRKFDKNDKRVDGVLGTRTWGGMKVGAEESTERCRLKFSLYASIFLFLHLTLSSVSRLFLTFMTMKLFSNLKLLLIFIKLQFFCL